jgi:hypothetical protein
MQQQRENFVIEFGPVSARKGANGRPAKESE